MFWLSEYSSWRGKEEIKEVLEGSDEGGFGFEREIGDSVRVWRGWRVTGREREE